MNHRGRRSLATKNQRGNAIVEFAFLAPFLLILALGVGDFGRAMYASIVVNNAARAGAQYAFGYSQWQRSRKYCDSNR